MISLKVQISASNNHLAISIQCASSEKSEIASQATLFLLSIHSSQGYNFEYEFIISEVLNGIKGHYRAGKGG